MSSEESESLTECFKNLQESCLIGLIQLLTGSSPADEEQFSKSFACSSLR